MHGKHGLLQFEQQFHEAFMVQINEKRDTADVQRGPLRCARAINQAQRHFTCRKVVNKWDLLRMKIPPRRRLPGQTCRRNKTFVFIFIFYIFLVKRFLHFASYPAGNLRQSCAYAASQAVSAKLWRNLYRTVFSRRIQNKNSYRSFIFIHQAKGGTAGRDEFPVSSPARSFKRAHLRLQKTPVIHP